MRKLKVLIVLNYGSKRAIVNGLPALSSLTQLKTIHLERLIVAPLQEHSQALLNSEKLSLSLCEGLGNMLSRFNSAQSSLELPLILDFNLDHCCDLEEFPAGICDMTSLQKISITNCHLLEKLPDDLGKLIYLRMLRLLACLGLKELPASIGKLGKLEYLDISLCECLEELPEEIGQLQKLKELDMRECSHLRKLPESVGGLKSLKHVLCDEQIGQQWMQVKSSALMELRVEVVEAHFSLDWLDDGVQTVGSFILRSAIERSQVRLKQFDRHYKVTDVRSPSLYGIFPYAGLKFYVYEELKRPVPKKHEHSMTANLVCGSLAGLVGQTCTYPLDVVRRQMQVQTLSANQNSASSLQQMEPKFKGTLDGLVTIVQRQGWKQMFSGLSINYVKVVPSVAIGFTTYDAMKSLLGVPSRERGSSISRKST